MGVVELHRVGLGKIPAVGTMAQQVLHGGAAQQILLAQAQGLAGALAVAGIEQGGKVRRPHSVGAGLGVILVVEGGHIDGVDGLGLPQPQGAHAAFQADDGHIVGHSLDGELGKIHLHGLVLPAHAPGVAVVGPVVGGFHLTAVDEALLEQAEPVIEAVAGERRAVGGGGVQIAGGQAAQTAVAQRGVLDVLHIAQVGALGGEQFLHLVIDAQAEEVVVPQTAHEPLGADIAGPALGEQFLLVLHPAGSDGKVHSLGDGVMKLKVLGVLRVRVVAGLQEALSVEHDLFRVQVVMLFHESLPLS